MALTIRCSDGAHEHRVRLLHAAQEVRSIVETASFDRERGRWVRGNVVLELSGPTFTMTGSRHRDANSRVVFQITTPLSLIPSGDAWQDAMAKASGIVDALMTLRGQTFEESTSAEPNPVAKARTAMIAAAALRSFTHFDLTVLAPCPGRRGSATLYHDGPEPWTLRPDVEASLFEDVPDVVLVDHTAGLDMVIVSPWELEEEPDDDSMETLRAIAECGLTQERLELRTSWPEETVEGNDT
jgi:hypothetical protein